jgi:PAS domain S-box-containing protein
VRIALERKIALGLGAAVAAVLLATGASWWTVAGYRETHAWVGRTRDILMHLQETLSHVLGMQASVRGFVLTGDDEVLVPFRSSRRELEQSLQTLSSLTADTPEQQNRLVTLETDIARARAVMEERIDARRTRGRAVLAETSAYREGQKAVDGCRATIRAMIADERNRLDRRLADSAAAGNRTVAVLAVAGSVTAAAVLLSAFRVRGDLRRRFAAEAELQASFNRIGDLYNRAPCGYHSLDASGTVIEMNDTALGWLGYSRAEVVGRMMFTDLLTPASVALFRERYPRFIRTGRTVNADYEWRCKDGSVLPVLLNASAIYGPDGSYLASRATVFDITDRKRAEAERDRFFTLSRDLLCIFDRTGGFRRVNPACEQALGYSGETLTGRSVFDLVHPDDVGGARAELAVLLTGRDTSGFEARLRTATGTYRWLSWSARAIPGEDTIYASAEDVTARKAAEDRILQLNGDLAFRAGQLEAANRELEAFSYSVSHDLRAPLRHIDGFANLLRKRAGAGLDSESRRYLATISKAAKQMGTLIDDLLAFSRIGRTTLRREPVDTDRLVRTVIAESHPENPDRPIVWELGELPAVHADPALLRQVWANLIDNAVKYTGKTPAPRIAIAGRFDAAEGAYVFSIRDNGVGFDMAYADKLFGVFQRLHASADFEGTGIGLANVRRIVLRHGGRTWAEGRVDAGATFHFSLPSDFPPPPASVRPPS